MKTFKQLLLSVLIFVGGTSYAQNGENLFEEFLYSGPDDAEILLGHYMAPGMKALGYGVNSGWYNTAKPHEKFGFDITFSYVNAIAPEEDKTFEFDPSEYLNTTLGSGTSTLPTIMGVISTSNLDYSVPAGQPVYSGTYTSPDGVAGDLESLTITSNTALPVPIVQVGVGLFKGTEIKVRWLPVISRDGFGFKYFGIGGLHSISQWIPVFKDMPVDISAFLGWTTISADYIIPDNSPIVGPGDNARATADVSTFTYQLIASAHVSVITGYIGLGMDNFKTNFKMLGDYHVDPAVTYTDPIDITVSGSGGFRTSFGARLKLSIVTLSADYTLREYDTLTLSLGFSVR